MKYNPKSQPGWKPPWYSHLQDCEVLGQTRTSPWGSGVPLPPKIRMQSPSALTPSYLCSLDHNGAFLLWEFRWNQTSSKASLLQELQNSGDKSFQHFHRIREHGVLKCLTTEKENKMVGKKESIIYAAKQSSYSILYFNSFLKYIFKTVEGCIIKNSMSALIITSCLKSKPSLVYSHNV